MNKKAIIIDIVEILWKFLLVIIIITCLAAVIFSYLNEKFDTDNLEVSILYSKFINSKNCLGYDNNINGQTLLDLNKFDKERLRQCGVKDELSLRLSLLTLENKDIKPVVKFGTEKAINLIDVCKATTSFKCFTKLSFVSYIDNGKIKPALLKMEIIKNV